MSVQIEYLQKANFMVNEIMFDEEEQVFITGMVMICDCTGYTLGHFTQVPMASMKKIMQAWEVFLPFEFVLLPWNF